MKDLFSYRLFHAATLSLCLLFSLHAQAGIMITNIEFSDYLPEDPSIATTLRFDLSGSIDDVITDGTEGTPITQNTQALYIGEIGKSGWVNDYQLGSWSYSDSTSIPTNVEALSSSTAGDRVVVGMLGGYYFAYEKTNPTYDITSISGTATITNGNFTPGATDPSKWQVSVGFNTFTFPDPETVTGGVVPEPTSIVILGLGTLFLARFRRDRPEMIAADV